VKGLREFKRVLEHNGRVLFNISNPLHPQSIMDFFVSAIRAQSLRNAGLQIYKMQTYKVPLETAKKILTKLGFTISDVIASGHYPVLIETFFAPFFRAPSESVINWYYSPFDRLENVAKGKNLLHTFAHTFVIKAINE
jgi:hypothetical protein